MKERLDILVTERGLVSSREQAKRHIMAGEVLVNGQREDKPGTKVKTDAVIELRGKPLPYVSRGGLKLEKAFAVFPLDVRGAVCLDIGASTGGFTDCMLQNGAARVYAVDVGYGQLDYRLRTDERVICMERTNFRYLSTKDLPERVAFASCDVSFISLTKILPPAHALLAEDGTMVCLIKPQFEAGREKVGKKGVVRDPKVHQEVIGRIAAFAQEDAGFSVAGLSFSPIRGPEGNIEYLLYLAKGLPREAVEEEAIRQIVEDAHAYFSDHRIEPRV